MERNRNRSAELHLFNGFACKNIDFALRQRVDEFLQTATSAPYQQSCEPRLIRRAMVRDDEFFFDRSRQEEYARTSLARRQGAEPPEQPPAQQPTQQPAHRQSARRPQIDAAQRAFQQSLRQPRRVRRHEPRLVAALRVARLQRSTAAIETSSSSSSSSSSTTLPPTAQSIDASRVEPTNDESWQCSVCMDNRKSVVFFPCKHMACCAACASQLQRAGHCPVCRRAIESAVHVFA